MNFLNPLMEKGRVWPLVLLAGLALAGCASQSSSPGSLVGEGRGTPLGDDISGFLAQAPAGAVVELVESPWGNNVQLAADAPYYAASGTECRRVQVIGSTQAVRDALACATSNGWTSRRLVTETSSAGGQ